ncbi:hypothetical protein ABTZ58_12895 [Streptomyces sp. NPDC094143]|uniref:FG-GAP repeat protein n=1 Tax=Streptomyces sp. NPDC094143 TaxID=3155310 RepID=UPI0033179A2D
MRRQTPAALAAALLTAGLTPLTLAAPVPAAPARHADDFNGDGYRDLAAARRTVLTQDSAGIPGTAEEGDRFGKALTSGDVNADGYGDLVVGSVGEDVGGDGYGDLAVGTIHEDVGTADIAGDVTVLTTKNPENTVSFGPGSLGVSATGYLRLGQDMFQPPRRGADGTRTAEP